ncbi:MAG TPA: hypothetical protein VF101_10880 [Gaiellaceae bacterium]
MLLAVAVPVLVVAAALASEAGGAPAKSALTFRISHYLCYHAKSVDLFRRRGVVLLDQFKPRRKTVVTGVQALCTPASKAGSRVIDKRAHLVCYAIKSAQTFSPRRVLVTNQFGQTQLTVTTPTSLCLPSAKSLEPTTAPPPIPKTIGHFQCYPGRPPEPAKVRTLTVADQFGKGKYAVGSPAGLCNPVSKNGAHIANLHDHLVCYGVDPLQKWVTRRVYVFNQFGAQQLVVAAPSRLCLPSLKKELP